MSECETSVEIRGYSPTSAQSLIRMHLAQALATRGVSVLSEPSSICTYSVESLEAASELHSGVHGDHCRRVVRIGVLIRVSRESKP